MTRLTKIFFVQIDKEKLLKSQNYERGFWDFEDVFIILNEPVNWEHAKINSLKTISYHLYYNFIN